MHILNFNFLDIIYRFRYLISLNELPSLNFITITYEIIIFRKWFFSIKNGNFLEYKYIFHNLFFKNNIYLSPCLP